MITITPDLTDERDVRDVQRIFRELRARGKRVRIVITECRPSRTLPQNAWYWGQVVPAAARGLTDAMGETYTPERAHEFFAGRFLVEPIACPKTGMILSTMVRSSAVLSVDEFGEYVEHVRGWCRDYLGVDIPDPDPTMRRNP